MKTEKYIDWAVKGAFIFGGFLLLKRFIKNTQKDNTEDKVLTDPDAALADELYLLLHPNGGGWFSAVENVNEEKVLEWSKKRPMNFNSIRTYYSKLTKGQSLLDEVKKALNENEYVQFTNNLKYVPKKLVLLKARPAGGVKTVTASVSFYDTKLKRYRLTNNSGKIGKAFSYSANETIGKHIATIPVYFKTYNKNIEYYFVDGEGKTAGKKLFVLKSQAKFF